MGSNVPARRARPLDKINTISDYARRYGVTNDPLFGDKKSGISPIDDDPTKAKDSEALVDLFDSLHYQEFHLLGFRTRLIEQFKALTSRGILKSDLRAIHPMIDRDRWQTELPRHLAFYPVMAPGKTGYWTASNDDVWEILVPILALASKFIDHFHLWQWWDTLTFGKREVIKSDKIPKVPGGKPPLVRVVPRPAEVVAANRDALEQAREKAGQKVLFGISSSYCWPLSGMTKLGGKSHTGISLRTWPAATDQIVVHLCFEELAPLMSSEITDEERLMQQLIVAKTLVHELGHSLSYTLYTSSGFREPYFADEPLIELGNSLINSIFGGNNMSEIILNRKRWWHLRDIHPMAAIFRKGWPTFSNVWLRADVNRPCLDPTLTEVGNKQYTFLLPLYWISDIQQEDYWDHQVDVYGADAIRPEPLTLGFIETLKSPEIRSSTRRPHVNSDWTGLYGPQDGPFTEEEKLARTQRITHAQEIALTLAGVVDEIYERKKTMRKDEKMTLSRQFTKSEESYNIPPGQGRPPKTYVKILKLLLDNRQQLALDTMVDWIPTNLFLSYIHRLGQWQVPPAEFYDFLTSCQAHETYFEYERTGTGQVRKREGPAWPAFKRTKIPIEPPPLYDVFMYGVARNKNNIHMCGLNQEDALLGDIDAGHMFQVLQRQMRNITREYFDHAIAYADYTDGYYIYGPEGIYRLNKAAPIPQRPPFYGQPAPTVPGVSSTGPSPVPTTGTGARTSAAPPAEPSTRAAAAPTTESTPDPMERISTGSDEEAHLPAPHYQYLSMKGVPSGKRPRNDDSSDDWNSWDDEVSAFITEAKFPGSDEDKLRRKRQKR